MPTTRAVSPVPRVIKVWPGNSFASKTTATIVQNTSNGIMNLVGECVCIG